MLSTKDIFKSGMCFALGDRQSIDIWLDSWCGDASLKVLFPDIYDLALKGVLVKECFSYQGWRWRKILRGIRVGSLRGDNRIRELKELLQDATSLINLMKYSGDGMRGCVSPLNRRISRSMMEAFRASFYRKFGY